MATSGSTNFATSRNALIEGALRILGVTAQGETPTATQYTEASDALNMMVKAWEADGMPLWAIKQYDITPVYATTSYRIGLNQTINTPKPLKIFQAYFHNDASDVDIPMLQLTKAEYNNLGNKASAGQPIQWYYDPQREYGDLFLYPVPDSAAATSGNYVRIFYQRPFEDFDSSTDEPDFPQEWFAALKYGLADQIAPEYGIPMQHRTDVTRRAKELKAEALLFGTEEGSYYFQADMRSW